MISLALPSASEPEKESIANKYMDSSIFRVVTEQPNSIQHYDGEKLYLNPENIRRVKEGHLLYNGHSVIFLPQLSFDHRGSYLARRSKDDLKLTCTNTGCGYEWWLTDNWSIYCPRCGSIGDDQG